MKFFYAIILLVVALTFVAADEQEDENDWSSYKSKFRKKHRAQDESRKRARFIARKKAIEKHNRENKEWKMGHNKFSDMTDEEMKSALGARPEIRRERLGDFDVPAPILDRALPASIDYRSDPCMQPVKEQGECGSCWSFATITPLEFNQCKKTGTPVSLSEQMLVDCDPYNKACNGGMYDQAWKFLKEKGGAVKTPTYPYVSDTTLARGTCKFNASAVGAQVLSYGWTQPYPNETVSMNYLQNEGPLPSAIKILPSIYNYAGGVYSDPACPQKLSNINDVDHAVVIVGYGTMSAAPNTPYWIVRNSWGPEWGNKGYFAIKRGVNMCNIEAWTAYVRVV